MFDRLLACIYSCNPEYIDVYKRQENIHPDAIFWPDISEGDWYFEIVMEATNSHDYTIEEDGDELWIGLKPNKVWP